MYCDWLCDVVVIVFDENIDFDIVVFGDGWVVGILVDDVDVLYLDIGFLCND